MQISKYYFRKTQTPVCYYRHGYRVSAVRNPSPQESATPTAEITLESALQVTVSHGSPATYAANEVVKPYRVPDPIIAVAASVVGMHRSGSHRPPKRIPLHTHPANGVPRSSLSSQPATGPSNHMEASTNMGRIYRSELDEDRPMEGGWREGETNDAARGGLYVYYYRICLLDSMVDD